MTFELLFILYFIASREEVRAKVAASAALKPSYAPDISYLDNASNNFLAAELARIETTDGAPVQNVEMHISTKTPRSPPLTTEEIIALTAKRRRDRLARTQEKPTSLMTQEIAALTAKSRGNRLARATPPMAQKIEALTAKRREDRIARTPDQPSPPAPQDTTALTAKRQEKLVSRATNQICSFTPILAKSRRLYSEFEKMDAFTSSDENPQPSFRSRDHPPPRPPLMRGPASGLNPSRQGRLDQRPGQQQYNAGLSKRPRARQSGPRPPVRRPTQNSTPSTYDHGIDESVFQPGGHLPQFSGPELPSSTIFESFGPTLGTKDLIIVTQSGTSFKTSLSKVSSFYKGDYSRYVGSSPENYSSSPDVLGAVKFAECTLAHQRQYNLSERHRMLQLVAQASEPAANLPSPR